MFVMKEAELASGVEAIKTNIRVFTRGIQFKESLIGAEDGVLQASRRKKIGKRIKAVVVTSDLKTY